MGFDVITRNQFCNAVTNAFSQRNIADSVEKLGTDVETGDHLDILHRLNLLPVTGDGGLETYRAALGIPELHQQIITHVLRSGLTATPPQPIVFHVNEGPTEGVDVKHSSGKIFVTVTRNSFVKPTS